MPLMLSCSCGKELRVTEAHAGKRIVCPSCGTSVAVPSGADFKQGRSPLATGATAAGKSSKTGVNLLLALLLFLILGGGIVGLVLYLRSGGKGSSGDGPEVSDMALLPPDVQMVTTTRLAELYRMPPINKAIEDWRKRNPQEEDPAVRLQRATGLLAEDVERFHVVSTNVDKQAGWVVARTIQPLNREQILRKLTDGVALFHEGRRYYLGKNSDGQEMAIHFAGPMVLVMSNEEGMKAAMTQAAKPVLDGRLKPIIALVETSKSQVIVGLNQEAGVPAAVKQVPLGLPLTKIKVVRLTMDVGSDAEFNAVAESAEDKDARSLNFWLTFVAVPAMKNLYLQGMKAKGGESEQLAERIEKFLDSMKRTVSGKEVRATVKSDPATVTEVLLTADKLLRQQPPAQK